ncbi:hypothetical protein HYS31_02820 [Candidatus Woesearchaeota archaeon]|nr:hypothetical protein [Candidatus Woesearchaeota archaeon]
MGLESVKEEILGNAKEQANSLIAEGRKEANRIMRENEKKIEELKEKSDAETKKIIDTLRKQESASSEMEAKKMILEAKKQIIESVFSDALKKLEAQDDKKRENYIKRLLERAKKDIEVSYVCCNKRDAKFLKGFSAEPISIAGGIIAENNERTIRVDYSFDTLLQGIKESELQNISKILFG